MLFLQEIYKDRKKFSKQVFEVASSDLVNMGITVVSYTLKDIRDEEVSQTYFFNSKEVAIAAHQQYSIRTKFDRSFKWQKY